MKYLNIFLLAILVFGGCKKREPIKEAASDFLLSQNMTSEKLSLFTWQNEAIDFEIGDGFLSVKVGEGTDFFNNPEDNSITASAPFLYQELEGDFVAKALIEPDFSSQWNAVALMVIEDSLNWIKFAFENSDATGPGIVSVVTRGTSDDANGAILKEHARIWLALVRKDQLYAMHWSIDGNKWYMARLTKLPSKKNVQIGIEMQSPVGKEATHKIHFFELEHRSVENLRDINGA